MAEGFGMVMLLLIFWYILGIFWWYTSNHLHIFGQHWVFCQKLKPSVGYNCPSQDQHQVALIFISSLHFAIHIQLNVTKKSQNSGETQTMQGIAVGTSIFSLISHKAISSHQKNLLLSHHPISSAYLQEPSRLKQLLITPNPKNMDVLLSRNLDPKHFNLGSRNLRWHS